MADRTRTVEAARAPAPIGTEAPRSDESTGLRLRPTEAMPGWLQAFANNSPVTAVVNAIPVLVNGGPRPRPS